MRAWAASVTSEVTRDGIQRLLCGEPSDSEAMGTGLIPKAAIVETKRRANVPNAIASVTVKHATGGNSSLVFKSYDQGREKFQADTLDIIWLDEEPPAPIYFEALTRTNATGGMVYMTFTPLLGASDVVMRFLGDPDVATDTELPELRG